MSDNEPEQSTTCRSGSEQDDGLENELQAAGATGDTAWLIRDDGQIVYTRQ
jgi:hypothetical protein